MKNLVFVSEDFKHDSLLHQSFNLESHVIDYTHETTETVLDGLDLSNLTHMAFVYYYPGFDSVPFFYDNAIGENHEPVKSDWRYFSNRLVALIETVKNVTSQNLTVDLLTCNLNKPDFSEEVAQLETETGVNFRYSLDKTGNTTHGGNWVMESDDISVQSQYFTDQILGWKVVLDSTINGSPGNALATGGSTTGDSSDVLEVTTSGSVTTIRLLRDITWDYNTTFALTSGTHTVTTTNYINLAAEAIFDGGGYTIDLGTNTGCEGLFASSASSFSEAPTIRNLKVTGGTTAVSGGFIVRDDQKYVKVEYCSVNGSIDGTWSGGICGRRVGCLGEAHITNCINTGEVQGDYTGGIVGSQPGKDGISRVVNCINRGDILGDGGGGIIGREAGRNGKITINGCINTGLISANNCGGIVGSYCGDGGYGLIVNCYNTSSSTFSRAGGIAGYNTAPSFGKVVICNNYSTGTFNTGNSGEITGDDTGKNNGNVLFYRNYSVNGSIGNRIVRETRSAYNGTHSISSMTLTTLNSNITLSTIKGYTYSGSSTLYFESFSLTPPTDGGFQTPLAGTYPMLSNFLTYPWSGYTSYNVLPTLTFSSNIKYKDTENLISSNSYFTVDSNTITLTQDITWDNSTQIVVDGSSQSLDSADYITLGPYSTFDGDNYTIDMGSSTSCDGLFASAATTYAEAPTIQNLKVIGGQTGYGGSFVLRSGEKYAVIDKCSVTGEIAASDSGGLTGRLAGEDGQITITNCFSTGDISGTNSGGITGARTCTNGELLVYNCYSSGDITGFKTGGILGLLSGCCGGKANVYNCYSTGNITDQESGGIGSRGIGWESQALISYCYSLGDIADYAGGILGSFSGRDGMCVIQNCYASGTASGSSSGEITGQSTGDYGGRVLIFNCYSKNGSGNPNNITEGDSQDGTYDIDSIDLTTLNDGLTLSEIQDQTGFIDFSITPPSQVDTFTSFLPIPKLGSFGESPWYQYIIPDSQPKLSISTGDLTADTGNYLDYIVKHQTTQDKFIVVGKDNSAGTYINILNNDMTIDRHFLVTHNHHYYNSIDVDSQGNFAYCGATGSSAAARVFYYSKSDSLPSWFADIGTTGSDHILKFLSNDNLVVGTINTSDKFSFTILSKTDGSVVSGPTVVPIDSDVVATSNTIVPYADYFALFWVVDGDKRYAARYSNLGALQTQTNYLLEDHNSSLTINHSQGSLIKTARGDNYLVVTYSDQTSDPDKVLLVINDPAFMNNAGQMKEISTRFGTNISNGPVVSPVNIGGIVSLYEQSGTLYYRSYHYKQQYSINLVNESANDCYLDLNTNLDLNDDFSIALWLKPTNYNSNIFSTSASDNIATWDTYDFSFNMNSNNQLSIGQNSGFDNYSPSHPGPVQDEWNHIALTHSSGTWNFYIDGINRITQTGRNIDESTPSRPTYIGIKNNEDVSIKSLTGKVTDIRLYSEELSADSVGKIFDNQPYTDNLTGWWIPKEGSGTTIAANGYGNDMTIRGSSATATGVWCSSDLPSTFSITEDEVNVISTVEVPPTTAKISDLTAAFPNLDNPHSLSSYRGLLSILPATGKISFSDLTSTTAPEPVHDFSIAYVGTNFSTSIRRNNSKLVHIKGSVTSSSRGTISFDLKQKLSDTFTQDTETMTYEIITKRGDSLPAGFTITNGIIQATDINARVGLRVIKVKCTNRYGNYTIIPVMLSVQKTDLTNAV